MVEEVFAGFELAPLSRTAQRFEGDAAAHHSIFGEEARNRTLRHAVRDINVDAAGREPLVRPIKSHVHVSRCGNQKKKYNEKKQEAAHVSLALPLAGARGPDSRAG